MSKVLVTHVSTCVLSQAQPGFRVQQLHVYNLHYSTILEDQSRDFYSKFNNKYE